MPERYLVTGASGFIGSTLVEALIARDQEVHCLLLPGDPAPHLEAVWDHIQVHRANLTDKKALKRVAHAVRPEAVIHLAAVGVTNVHIDPVVAVRVNVQGTLNLLQALDGDYRILINTGTCHEYGTNDPPFREDQAPQPELPYAITKTAAWHFCQRLHKTKGWPIATVRPFAVYGPRQPAKAFIPACIRAAQRGIDFEMTGGEQQRDLIFVEDIVTGLIAAASTPDAAGETFNLCTGREVALYEVAQTIVEHMGNPIAIRCGALPYREGEIWHLVGDNSRARTILGWEPRVSLAEGLDRTIAYVTATPQPRGKP